MTTHPLLFTMDSVASSVCGLIAATGALALTGISDWVESGSVALALAVALPPIGFVSAALGSSWLQQHWPHRDPIPGNPAIGYLLRNHGCGDTHLTIR